MLCKIVKIILSQTVIIQNERINLEIRLVNSPQSIVNSKQPVALNHKRNARFGVPTRSLTHKSPIHSLTNKHGHYSKRTQKKN